MESRPTSEEVISKLKDDGDFDALRLKIIRRLKENEDLRNRIISEVKQSAALNQEGAQKLKPRQLSDSIHQEIGNKIMDQISDELWKIIRSTDGMQTEIKETVESVYNKLLNPLPVPSPQPLNVKEEHPSPKDVSTCETTLACENDPDAPPGFSLSNRLNPESNGKEVLHEQLNHQRPAEESKEEIHGSPEIHSPNDNGPPGFSKYSESAELDDDPDVPPGFG